MITMHDTPTRRFNLTRSIDLTKDIEISRREIAEGKGIPHTQVMSEMEELINRLATREEKL
jgi:hypothetical protein